MKKEFKFSVCDGQVLNLPASKSITNRALLLASFAHGTSYLKNVLDSDDTHALLGALHALGVSVRQQGSDVEIDGVGIFPNKTATLQCQDAGTAARFLCAACAAMPGEYSLQGSARLSQRPLDSLISVLRAQGAAIDADHLPCVIQGAHLKGGDVFLESSASSQFVSALLMIAPFMKNDLHLTVQGLARDAYIHLTCAMMKDFGVTLAQHNFVYQVPAHQTYQARTYVIEPDLSTASYFFAKAALTHSRIVIKNINREHCLQGDIQFLKVLESMGCHVNNLAEGVEVIGPAQLRGVEVNMNNFSDTFMTLACLAPFATTPTTITGLAHTRLQESDRIAAIATELKKLNVQVETGKDWIRIFPSTPIAADVFSHHDHRVVMSLALMGLRVPGIVCVDAHAVSKTCPEFFELFGFAD